jgi:D-glycero-D-manno-heptose 1,7-bisphosphate phosphatase
MTNNGSQPSSCPAGPPLKTVFLDRDGVINVKLPENRYVKDIEEFEFLPGAIEALTILKKMGYLLILITNQRGIARGLMTPEDLERVHNHLRDELSKHNVILDEIYHCPHENYENCMCRKPQPGMIFTAMEQFNIDVESSYMVGDSKSDILAGQRAGVRTIRICGEHDEEANLCFPNLLAFAQFLNQTQGSIDG